jgi:hypothetical protein
VCSKLAPDLWCLQVSKCADGGFQDVLHQHVPAHRLAQESVRSEWLVSAVSPDVWTWGWEGRFCRESTVEMKSRQDEVRQL